jgi:hypothetical protein
MADDAPKVAVELAREFLPCGPMWRATITDETDRWRRRQDIYAYRLKGLRRRVDRFLRAREWFEDPARFDTTERRIEALEARLGIGGCRPSVALADEWHHTDWTAEEKRAGGVAMGGRIVTGVEIPALASPLSRQELADLEAGFEPGDEESEDLLLLMRSLATVRAVEEDCKLWHDQALAALRERDRWKRLAANAGACLEALRAGDVPERHAPEVWAWIIEATDGVRAALRYGP